MSLEIHLYLPGNSTHQRSYLPLKALNILQSHYIAALIKLVWCFVSKKTVITVINDRRQMSNICIAFQSKFSNIGMQYAHIQNQNQVTCADSFIIQGDL